MEKILNKCPICGSGLEFHVMYQDTDVYKILKNGKISKRKSKSLRCPMESSFIGCSNPNCEFVTDIDFDVIYPSDFCGIIRQIDNGIFMINEEE